MSFFGALYLHIYVFIILYQHLKLLVLSEIVYIFFRWQESQKLFIRQAAMFNRGISFKIQHQSKPLIIYILTYDQYMFRKSIENVN